MKSIRIRTLRSSDVEELLAFELENRTWFERHVAPRSADFYSTEGVRTHIATYLSDFSQGSWHPFVIVEPDGKIVGRANLKSIGSSDRSAEVGYRIAEKACGRGLATLALRHLTYVAKVRWGLVRLVAYVDGRNIGSIKVLNRCGFSSVQEPVNGGENDLRRFVLSIEANGQPGLLEPGA